jgi:D-alanyl-lipoteichoic acid acyltransferase DltB (MBOAT superfamily)
MERFNHFWLFDKQDPLMLNQLDFWLFFLLLMALFSFLHKNKLVRSIFLTAISLFFYYKTSGLSVIILGISLIFNFFTGRQIAKSTSTLGSRTFLVIGILLNLLILGYFKYAYFFTESFNEIFHSNYEVFNIMAQFKSGFSTAGNSIVEKIVVPFGVSFFTFSSISYIVDVHRKEVKPFKNFFDYSFFVSFFPHIAMGPIARAKDFIPQINAPYSLDKEEFSWAIAQIVKGLVKKLILADFIMVHFVDLVVDHPENYPGFVSIVAMWGYSLQIYGDFSGYIDIARGVSKLMGFNLSKNFNSPYKSTSLADFWRRWHISLGSWFRDYLYIPLGGNKTGGIGSFVGISIIFIFLIFITQWYELIFVYVGLMAIYGIIVLLMPKLKIYIYRDLNLLITMVVGGLWHNPHQNFVIWGALNGIGLVLYNHWRKVSPYEKSNWLVIHFWKIFITFNFITFTRLWFRLKGEEKPIEMLNHITQKFNFSWEAFSQMCTIFMPALIVMVTGYIIHWLPEKTKNYTLSTFTKIPVALQVIVVSLIIFLTYQLMSEGTKPIYFSY